MTMQIIEQTRGEREVMYMKMTKKKLIQMLMNNQDTMTDLIHKQPTRWQDRAGAGLGGQLGRTE